jgi:hypothetical protein
MNVTLFHAVMIGLVVAMSIMAAHQRGSISANKDGLSLITKQRDLIETISNQRDEAIRLLKQCR